MTDPAHDSSGRFPVGVVLPEDPPAWLRRLVDAGLDDSSLSAWSRIPKSEAEFEQACFDHAEACYEAERDYDAGAEPDDPPFSESEFTVAGAGHEEEVLLDVALALVACARVASDPDDLVSRIMEWCEEEIDRVWEQMETAEDGDEHEWCTIRSSCIQDYNEAFDAAPGRLQLAFAELIEARQ